MDKDHGLGLSKFQGTGSLSAHFSFERELRRQLCSSQPSCESCEKVTCLDGFEVGPCDSQNLDRLANESPVSKSVRRRRTSDWIREVDRIGLEDELGMNGCFKLFQQLALYGVIFALGYFLLFGT